MQDNLINITSETGIPVYINSRDTEISSIRILVKTGSAYEEIPGIAHILEHMGFKGTGKRTKDGIQNTIDRFGGRINAGTGHESITYMCDCHMSGMDEVFDTMADIVCDPTVDANELDMEKKIILQELAMIKTRAPSYFLHKMIGHVLRGSPYEHEIIGTADTINGSSRDDVLAFHDGQFVRNNISVFAAGKIDTEKLMKAVDNTVGTLPAGKKNPVLELPINKKDYLFIEGSKDSSYTAMAFTAKLTEQEADSLNLLSGILTSGLGSRLYKELRDKRGLIYNLMPSNIPMAGSIMFTPGFVATEGNVREGLNAMASVLKSVKEEGVTAEELNIVKMKELVKVTALYESTSDRADSMAFQYSMYGKVPNADEVLRCIQNVTCDSIMDVARKVMDPKNMNVVVYGNDPKSMSDFTLDELDI